MCSFHGYWTWSLTPPMASQGRSKKGISLPNSSSMSLWVSWYTLDKHLLAITTPLSKKRGSFLYSPLKSISQCLKTCCHFSTQPMPNAAIPEDEVVDSASGKWLRFNDNLVDEFTMTEPSLEAECFGGSYKAKATDG